MEMHTRVRLVILGTFLFNIFVLQKCVSTYLYYIYAWQIIFS